MSKRKSRGGDVPQTEAPPEKPKPKKRLRPGRVNINVWVKSRIGDAFLRYVEETRPEPSLTSAAELALEEFLIRVGYLEPKK